MRAWIAAIVRRSFISILRSSLIDTPHGQPFDLVRVWGRGGKTNVWGRVSLRYSDVDFAGPEKDGWEIPWPIRYKDIQPYYDKVDQFIGVCGGNGRSGFAARQSLHAAGAPAPLRRKAVAESAAGRSACRSSPADAPF